MIRALLVGQTALDRGNFLLASRQITNQNHALRADREGLGQLPGDIDILDSFAGKPIGDALISASFLFVGPTNEIDELTEHTRGVPYLSADSSLLPVHAKAVVVTASVFHWSNLVIEGCRRNQEHYLREAFTQVHRALCNSGLHNIFDGYRQSTQTDGTILLLPSS